MSMLLIHDLGEIYAGDTFIFDDVGKSDSYGQRAGVLENQGFGKAAARSAGFLSKALQEFETGISIEAKYARVLDALVPLLNHFWKFSLMTTLMA